MYRKTLSFRKTDISNSNVIIMEDKKTQLTNEAGIPVGDNQNSRTTGPRGPELLENVWLLEKLAHFNRERIPERIVHAKGCGAFGTFTVTNDITRYTKAAIFSKVGKKTDLFARFSTVAGERGAADTERDVRGFALKFYTDEGNWDLVGNNTPVFFVRDPLKFPDFIHTQKRDPKTNLRSNTAGLLEPDPGIPSSGDDPDERPWYPPEYAAATRFRKPYLQFLQCRRQTGVGEISYDLTTGNR